MRHLCTWALFVFAVPVVLAGPRDVFGKPRKADPFEGRYERTLKRGPDDLREVMQVNRGRIVRLTTTTLKGKRVGSLEGRWRRVGERLHIEYLFRDDKLMKEKIRVILVPKDNLLVGTKFPEQVFGTKLQYRKVKMPQPPRPPASLGQP